ncbi:MAG TPA: O-acetyl-ADP-ribose deacetylase [Actinomycetes bacterium]|nr:O-acetyl-ADP-ribose deacetylase [Actinomycetes bacterium]
MTRMPGPASGRQGEVTVTCVEGDITVQQVDVVVNAANSTLLGGGGVDGAIHRAGGPAILTECRLLRASELPEGLPPGQAVATTAGELPARWVVHTVGPNWRAGQRDRRLLVSCYRESLRVADELGAVSVAFPAISAGVYGWPVLDAAHAAVEGVLAAAPTLDAVRDVRFVLFGPTTYAAFAAAVADLAPPSNPH